VWRLYGVWRVACVACGGRTGAAESERTSPQFRISIGRAREPAVTARARMHIAAAGPKRPKEAAAAHAALSDAIDNFRPETSVPANQSAGRVTAASWAALAACGLVDRTPWNPGLPPPVATGLASRTACFLRRPECTTAAVPHRPLRHR